MTDRGSGGPPPGGDGGRKDGAHEADRALSDRLSSLGRSLERHAPNSEPAASSPAATAGWGQAVRVSSEFIAGVIVGGGIGWIVDWVFGTLPIGLVVFVLLGFAAGVLNVLRVTGRATLPGGKAGRD